MTGIYKIINNINGKVYIGQAVNFEKRKNGHIQIYKRYLKNNDNHKSGCVILYNAFKKYGVENFIFEFIEECSKILLNEREQYWMDYYNSYERKYGYNLSKNASSSLGTKRSNETRKKLSENAKKRIGEKNPFFNKRHTNESKNIMSLKRKGKSRNKNSTEKWLKHKIWETITKKILQYDIWGNFQKEWDSLKVASELTNIKIGRISECLNGHQPTAGGYIWKLYYEDYSLTIIPNISDISFKRNFNKYYN